MFWSSNSIVLLTLTTGLRKKDSGSHHAWNDILYSEVSSPNVFAPLRCSPIAIITHNINKKNYSTGYLAFICSLQINSYLIKVHITLQKQL